MSFMKESTYEELLNSSRTKIKLGDSYSSVLNFLKERNANDVTIREIFSVLNEEEKIRKLTYTPIENKKEKQSGIKKGVGRLIFGLVIMVLAWFYFSSGLEVGRVFFLPAIAIAGGGLIGLLGLLQILVLALKK